VEAILSVALFMVIATSFIGAIFYGQEGLALSGIRWQALNLATEGLAVVRNIRDDDFALLVDGNYGLAINNSQWELIANSDVSGNFTRTIEIQSISPSVKMINVKVDWRYGATKNGQIELVSYLGDWRRSQGELKMEIGLVSTDEQWLPVSLANTYVNPIVVASVYNSSNNRSVSVRIRNVTPTSLEIRLQDPAEKNLSADEVAYWVVEQGSWEIDGLKIEAGKHNTDTVGASGNWRFDTKSFNQSFDNPIVVLHQVMSFNDASWISSYVSNLNSQTEPPDSQGMRIALNGAEAYASHNMETIGWIAVSANTTSTIGIIEGETYQTDNTVRGRDDGCFTFDYQNNYAGLPIVLASQQEMADDDGSWAVVCSNSLTQVGLRAEEDQVVDNERSHLPETFGLAAFAGPMIYPACECLAWTNNQCGSDSCSAEQIHQTRICSPVGCDFEQQCLDDSCDAWVNQGCGLGDCGADYMAQARVCLFGCLETTQCVLDSCGAWGNWYCLNKTTLARERTCLFGCLPQQETQSCPGRCAGNQCR